MFDAMVEWALFKTCSEEVIVQREMEKKNLAFND